MKHTKEDSPMAGVIVSIAALAVSVAALGLSYKVHKHQVEFAEQPRLEVKMPQSDPRAGTLQVEMVNTGGTSVEVLWVRLVRDKDVGAGLDLDPGSNLSKAWDPSGPQSLISAIQLTYPIVKRRNVIEEVEVSGFKMELDPGDHGEIRSTLTPAIRGQESWPDIPLRAVIGTTRKGVFVSPPFIITKPTWTHWASSVED